MKKALFSLIMGAAALTAGAQVVEVQSIQAVPLSDGLSVNIPRVSPDGSFAVVSSNTDNSLYRVDLSNGAFTRLGATGSALELAFTPDGSNIVFKTSTTRDNHLRYYSVTGYELATGYTRNLTKAARHCPSYTVSPQGVLSLNAEGRHSARTLAGKKATTGAMPVVGIHYGHLEVTLPGQATVNLDPQGKGSYLWPQLSPDGTRIVYYLNGHGCFTCNIDGSDIKPLGEVLAPRWLNNSTIVGCTTMDDGQVFTSGAIVAVNLQGTTQRLTDESLIALNPSASADGKTITFATATGRLYTITLK